ncbi:hypothetical protein HPP92_025380 [Vanilla planifolia]|uniref:Uncharacterized protein n=1 Tax=Vanilla planifolia TaxID=51239 RepID=A0A835PID3_VANPL|nr:hypothetical protein HPP92_025380 [Vanilla planifolia]
MAVADEQELVDDSRKPTSDEWADPVDPVVRPHEADECRAEGHRRVHRRAGERTSKEDVGAHDEADRDGGDGPEIPPLGVHSGGVHRVDQTEGYDDLEDKAVDRADAGETKGPGGEAGNGRAQELGDPVEDPAQEGDVAAKEEAEGHRRVHVAAGDVRSD